jgi:hypothetical protein
MANITISNLQVAELEYEELSDLEIEAVVGGKKHTTTETWTTTHTTTTT